MSRYVYSLSSIAAIGLVSFSIQAADVVVQPAAGSGFVVKDATGSAERLRVQESGAITLPGMPGATAQSQGLCMSSSGQLGPCSGGSGGGSYTAGTGLTLAGTVFSVAPTYRLPQGCASNQIAQWNGSAWACASAGSGATLPAGSVNQTLRYDASNALVANGLLQALSDGGLVASGAVGGGSIPVMGDGARLMWYPGKAAFRAGSTGSGDWDDTNIGLNSAVVGGGRASGSNSIVLGSGYAAGDFSVALEGASSSGAYSIAQGPFARASGGYSIAMGQSSFASADHTVAMGFAAKASGIGSIALGGGTLASNVGATALGNSTTASGAGSTAMGFSSDTDKTIASGNYSTAMGLGANASGLSSIAMGERVKAQGSRSVALGYDLNNHNPAGDYSVAIGSSTEASGDFSTAMGFNTYASGTYSTAMGSNVEAGTMGSFVYGDSGTRRPYVGSNMPDQFLVFAMGGINLYSGYKPAIPPSTPAMWIGAGLAPGSSSWTAISDRNAKTAVRPVDGREVLEKVVAIPLNTWQYKTQDEKYRHMGPMAQDFYAAFHLGESDKGIDTIDADGVALAAIQGLNAKLDDKEHEIVALTHQLGVLSAEKDGEIGALRVRVASLESLVGKLAKVEAEVATMHQPQSSTVALRR